MGITRKVNRTAKKNIYKKFSDSWRNEKIYQRFLLDKGDMTRDDTQILKRKPSFNRWLNIVKTVEVANQATPEQVQDFDESINLEWDEGNK